jgi:HAD superfamily hydrolase (TIGR01509 family)
VEISPEVYYRELAGLSDPAIIERGLELGGVAGTRGLREQLLRAKTQRYNALATRESPINETGEAFVRAAAERVPVAIASGAPREEVEHVLELSRLRELFTAVVCIDDVRRGKPDPEAYNLALAGLNREGARIAAEEVLVFEDADPGVQAAKAAGMRCAALTTPAYTGRPVAADVTLPALDAGQIEALLT